MKLAFVAFFSLLMVGCAAPIVQVEVPNLERSSAYQVEDLRPETEKQQEIFSYLVTSKAYGIFRSGDQTAPSPVRLLQHRVHEKFSDSGEFPNVKVHHFVTYANLQSELRISGLASTVGGLGGVVGGAVAGVISSSIQKYGVDGIGTLISPDEFNLIKDEYKRGMYSETENPGEVSVLQVYLDAEIDGERKFIKIMSPIHLDEQVTQTPIVVAIEMAIDYYLDQYQI
ncbi:hypothetical protein [Vibrio sp. SCSIO 43136]|uniref:hypothetical protein n=1 Tax=Vibrio sp. SCSIO 43136 TaxID=2819101 RepID=UPI0020765539|nr:hypothetical protein [Vibrio sp. SCSIO 43136]USD67864.1 hypothetical protein J4N39_16905 [Vibrio sp. SCSIO 43136]